MSEYTNNLVGYHIPSGTFIRGFIAGIMKDPEVFSNPNQFKPERFIDVKTGKYKFDPRVCNFSVGLKNCPGTTLSRKVLSRLTSKLLLKFEISSKTDKIEIVPSDGGMMAPEKLNLKFHPLS